MYTGKVYGLKDMIRWTRYETVWFVFYIVLWVSIYHFLNLHWFTIPWTPMALIGTAVAFMIGFQNNSVYSRIWEARKIWGGIVNISRTFGVFTQDMIEKSPGQGDRESDKKLQEEIKVLTYRHIAWMTALRHAMRQGKPWETTNRHKTNREWGISPPERDIDVKTDMSPYLSEKDMDYTMSMSNHQTALLYLQSHHLKQLKNDGVLWEFSFLEMEGLIKELFNLQGKTERIKNFPYPRQYASLNRYFMWVLLLFLPMAMIPQFVDIGDVIKDNHPLLGEFFIWFSIPIYIAIAWIFHTMERIGRTGENPFEGTANDVPISTIARGIEIDLRQNLGENKEEIPKALKDQFGVQF